MNFKKIKKYLKMHEVHLKFMYFSFRYKNIYLLEFLNAKNSSNFFMKTLANYSEIGEKFFMNHIQKDSEYMENISLI